MINYTGRANYSTVGGVDFVKNPDLALIPELDVKAAITFWDKHKVNNAVDRLSTHISVLPHKKVVDNNFNIAVRLINGSDTNIARRAMSYNRYINIFQP